MHTLKGAIGLQVRVWIREWPAPVEYFIPLSVRSLRYSRSVTCLRFYRYTVNKQSTDSDDSLLNHSLSIYKYTTIDRHDDRWICESQGRERDTYLHRYIRTYLLTYIKRDIQIDGRTDRQTEKCEFRCLSKLQRSYFVQVCSICMSVYLSTKYDSLSVCLSVCLYFSMCPSTL